jgi:conjugative transfer signal peptidase TraF
MAKLRFPERLTIPVRIARHAALGALGLMALGFVCFAAGLRINTTKSIPIGLYRITDVPVAKGEYVIFCPPQSAVFEEAWERGYIGAGFCPGGYGFLMKRVAALVGDVVTSTEEGMSVNGTLLPASAPLEADKAGRVLSDYQLSDYVLKESEILLMSDVSATSFDGRYFGLVNLPQMKGVILPVITFRSKDRELSTFAMDEVVDKLFNAALFLIFWYR